MGVRNTIDWLKAQAILYHIGRGSMAAAAEYLGQRAVDYAPVDTMFLAQNIKVYAGTGDIAAEVISHAYYSQWVEFGHMTPGGTWVAPRPYMRMAMADTVREFPEIVRRYTTTRPLEGGGAEPYLMTSISF